VEISALTNTQLEEGESLAVTLVDDQGHEQELELLPVGGGNYAAQLDQVSQGVYLLSARRLREGKAVGQALGGFAVPYPPEFQIQRHSGGDLLETLAERTGGRVLTGPEDVHTTRQISTRLIDITWWLLLAAIIVWPVDIALRRLGGLPPRRKKPQPPTAQRHKDQETDETMDRLLSAKRRKH